MLPHSSIRSNGCRTSVHMSYLLGANELKCVCMSFGRNLSSSVLSTEYYNVSRRAAS